jgi:hypothetical protein
MKAISPTTAKATKAAVNPKSLSPRKNPKGGVKRNGSGCDDWGCGSNHNDVVVMS